MTAIRDDRSIGEVKRTRCRKKIIKLNIVKYMAQYRISGVWKDFNNVITHYAIHAIGATSTSRATKYSKAQAIALLEQAGNSATTWVWNYKASGWVIGETVTVVNGPYGKFLRSSPDSTLTDNLAHLIDFDWIAT